MYVYNYMIWHLQTAASIFYRVFSQELYACNFLIRYRNVLTFCQIFCVLYNVFVPCAICIRVHSQWKTLPKCAEGAAGSNENLENIWRSKPHGNLQDVKQSRTYTVKTNELFNYKDLTPRDLWFHHWFITFWHSIKIRIRFDSIKTKHDAIDAFESPKW